MRPFLFSLLVAVAGCNFVIAPLGPLAGEDLSRSIDSGGTDPNGAPCATAGQCASGFCVVGLCCDQACTDPCRVCDATGMRGQCVPAVAGTDPKQMCMTSSFSSCGSDGACDGKGACQLWPPSVVCDGAVCVGDALQPARHCSGAGSCQPAGAPQSCGNYTCDKTTAMCFTACMSDSECSATRSCNNGKCK